MDTALWDPHWESGTQVQFQSFFSPHPRFLRQGHLQILLNSPAKRSLLYINSFICLKEGYRQFSKIIEENIYLH